MPLDGKQLRAASVPPSKLVKLYSACELGAAVNVAGTTLADIGLLQFALTQPGTYSFNFSLLILQTVAVGIVGVGVNYTGTFARLGVNAILATAATAATYRCTQLNNTALTDNAARAVGTAYLPTQVSGSIMVTGAGTLSLRAQRSAGTTTIGAQSSGLLIQL